MICPVCNSDEHVREREPGIYCCGGYKHEGGCDVLFSSRTGQMLTMGGLKNFVHLQEDISELVLEPASCST